MPFQRLHDPTAQPWERNYALATHLAGFAWHLLIPVVPSLIMWLIKREESAFIDDHGREAINFQLSLLVYGLIGLATFWICGLGFLVWAAAYVLGIVGMILGAIAASKGEFYRYPACLRFL